MLVCAMNTPYTAYFRRKCMFLYGGGYSHPCGGCIWRVLQIFDFSRKGFVGYLCNRFDQGLCLSDNGGFVVLGSWIGFGLGCFLLFECFEPIGYDFGCVCWI